MAIAISPQIASNGLMPDFALPVSVSITQQQLAWLELLLERTAPFMKGLWEMLAQLWLSYQASVWLSAG